MGTYRIPARIATLSAAGLLAIAGFEGYRASAYDDGVGVQTIGFGTTQYDTGAPVQRGDTITPARALVQLGAAADKTQRALARCVTVPVSQNEWDALTSWAYNVGTGAACNSTLVRKLNAGDYTGACDELLRWNKAGGRILPGLVKRRAAERALCLTPETQGATQ